MTPNSLVKPSILALIFITSGCYGPRKLGTIQFDQPVPEITTTNSLRNFLRSNPNPSIVLRFPKTINEGTQLNSIYQTIEEELIRNGFTVRDQYLFTKAMERTIEPNYLKISENTDTDLIIEMSGIDSDVLYARNTFIDKKGKKIRVQGEIQLSGTLVEFRVILIKSNELAGTYRFNYAPCVNGCKYYIDEYGNLYRASIKTPKIESYEVVEADELKEFIVSCTRDLIDELR